MLFGFVLPPTVVGLRSLIYRTLQCRLVIFGFPVRQKRGCDPQCLNFLFQPRHPLERSALVIVLSRRFPPI